MAYMDLLQINGEPLPPPSTYEIALDAVEADTNGETEAGTIQRDVVREGIVKIKTEFQVTAVWLKKLTAFSKEKTLSVRYFDTDRLELVQTQMYLDNFSTKLKKDTSYKGLWIVSFQLNEF